MKITFKLLITSIFFPTMLIGQTPTLLKDIISGNVGGFQTASTYNYYDYPFSKVWEKNGEVFFIACNFATVPNGSTPTNNLELWKSDGTTSGTVLLKDINPGNNPSYPSDFIDINGTLYFTAFTNALGRELWKTDGTSGGTVLVKEIINGTVGGFQTASTYNYYDYAFSVVWQTGNTFYFTANGYASVPNGNTPTNNIELWKSDGTAAGTEIVKDIFTGNQSSYPTNFTAINGTLYFTAFTNALGRELWKTDGSNGGTQLVKEIINGTIGGFQTASTYDYYDYPLNVVWQTGNTFYFTANGYASVPNGNTPTNNIELWKSDGTDAGTMMVKDIYVGNASSYPSDFRDINGTLYFTAYTNALGRELWKTDGSNGGTQLVKEIINGTVGGFQTASTYNYYDYAFSVVWQTGNTFYFTANGYASVPNGNTPTNNIELWKSDGTAAGTEIVKDIFTGNQPSYPANFTAINGTLYFTAFTNALGRELWKTDGSNGGTQLVKEIINGTVGGFQTASTYDYYDYPLNVVWQTGNTFYFTANGYASVPNGNTPTNNIELWKSDGTASGTVIVKDIYIGNPASYPSSFRDINGTLYFTAYTNSLGRELWKSDGTTGGTTLVKEIINGTVGGFQTASTYDYYDYPFNVVFNIGNSFYFVANDYASVPNGNTPNNNIELWKSDGTPGGTSKVLDIHPSTTDGSYPSYFTNALGKIFFIANDNSHGNELWTIAIPVSDGEELTLDQSLKIFPNPTAGNLFIEYHSKNSEQRIENISLTDLRGRELYFADLKINSNYFRHTLDINSLAPGMYCIKLSTDSGSIVKKVIKE
ncbi:MAG: T9SS type A sorting domain-containing protein [Bacteroidetes bacterium]|nr:T9SS type A sorting domain-containing protein [Bacteroidota bacterium]